MSSSNPIWDAIEDELIKHLEVDAELSLEFRIYLSPEEMRALLFHGIRVDSNTQQLIPVSSTTILMDVVGHSVTLYTDPEPYTLH